MSWFTSWGVYVLFPILALGAVVAVGHSVGVAINIPTICHDVQ